MVSKRILSFIVAGCMMTGSISAHATGNPNVTTQPTASAAATSDGAVRDAVCDPSVFARIKQKGWMEAQRENYINQSLIKRPVNTFAATCFDKQLGLALGNLGVSEREQADNESSPESMTPFKTGVVKTAGTVTNGLIGPLAGGKPLLPGSGVGSTQTTYSNYASPPTEGDFSCDSMNQIWNNVSCENMAGSDLPSLGEIETGNEARSSGTQACSNNTNDTSGADGAAETYNYTNAINKIYAPVTGANKLDLQLCKTLPYSQLASAGCPQTCTTVAGNGNLSSGKKSKNCPNKGCVYDSGSETCVPQR